MFNPFHDLPKISCLMVTGDNRFKHFVKSCECFFSQTYPNKELIVINDSEKQYQDEIKRFLSGKKDVNLVLLNHKSNLGVLRNISISLCLGDLFVQWDDDDFNIPERLSLQYSCLSKHPNATACYFGDQLHYYFASNEIYWESWAKYCSGGNPKYSLIPGTLMAYRDNFDHRYRNSKLGEDSFLAYDLSETEEVVILNDCGYSQVYSYHGNNVWNLDHHRHISLVRAMPKTYIQENKAKIIRTIDLLKLNKPIKIMSRDGLVFSHE